MQITSSQSIKSTTVLCELKVLAVVADAYVAAVKQRQKCFNMSETAVQWDSMGISRNCYISLAPQGLSIGKHQSLYV